MALFAFVCLVSAALVTLGVAMLSIPVAFIVAGILLALIGWVMLSE